MELQIANGGSVAVSDEIFAREFNEGLVHQAVVAYMAAGRAGTKAQKTRSDVSGGGCKPFKQKGTGRARAGSIRSPLWRTGGKSFAARPRDFTQKLNKKMYRAAMRAIFSELLRQDRFLVVDSFNIEEPKTKLMLAKLKEYGSNDVLLVSDVDDVNVLLSARNIPYCEVTTVAGLNPVSLVGHQKVVVTTGAVSKIQEWLA
ncbi:MULTISPECIES: 50S ribosomal protein L4 [Thiothrix]|jgi:large subunit ribosomal protein L4|uniref:Large ribosomal subunit protein uL4 n=2 Tax=Thiothrix TaxID=1030 RepID=A0AA51MMR4_9GAMM|nr:MULTISPECIES: 50S ribosomal protein L4 [Thiothrix]MBO0613165.1 50S ribosomal protein L4 [Thiothrix fructosivorans]MDQ5768447.1 50S ribosomal protein L4 [Thiothrix subterranea]QTX11395.1 50S ribosomal protein L4 [Thiothrix fructosivorans]WML87033.1 50S ribosomal protein L4 [Thiothrix subterranea]